MGDNQRCQECENLERASTEARRYASMYRPFMHSDRRPRSRWCKADRDAKDQAERSANLAEAKYYLHRSEHHKGDSDPQSFVRNFNIVMRNGRLKP
jgi:hypothetical protein